MSWVGLWGKKLRDKCKAKKNEKAFEGKDRRKGKEGCWAQEDPRSIVKTRNWKWGKNKGGIIRYKEGTKKTAAGDRGVKNKKPKYMLLGA